MRDLVEYLKWLYSDFPNLIDFSFMMASLLLIAIAVAMEVRDRVRS